jgi:aspartate racemase
MHAHGGNVLEYFALANHLDSDQPVYALQSEGLDGNIRKDRTLEEMTANYIKEMRTLQPEGPYFLGGFCFGGLLALEAAQQLTSAGEEVALLAMIQTTHPDAERFDPSLNALQRFWYRMTNRLDIEFENLGHRGFPYILERIRRAWDIGHARTLIARDAGRSTPRKNMPMPYILEALTIENDKAVEKYRPRVYRGHVVLFRSNKQLGGLLSDDYLGWKELFPGNLDVCEVPGHQQNTVLEPHVIRLAEELSCRLRTAQQKHGFGEDTLSDAPELAAAPAKRILDPKQHAYT